MNRKIVTILVASGVVLVFGIVLAIYLYQVSPNTKVKKVLMSEVTSIRNIVSETYSSTYNSLYSKKVLSNNKKATVKFKPTSTDISISSVVSLNNDLKKNKENKYALLESILSNSKLSLQIDTDSLQNYALINVNYGYNKEKTKADIIVDDNDIYFKDKDFLNKYILFNDLRVVDVLNSGVTLNDVNYLLAVFSKTIKDTNFKQNITSTKETVKLSDKVISANKDTLKLDETLLKSFANNLIKNILSDNKAINITSKLTSSENTDELKDNLSAAFTQLLSKDILKNGNISISTYTTGMFPTFVMQTINYNDTEISLINSNVIDALKHIVISSKDEKITINIAENKNKKDIQIIIEKDNDKYLFDINGTITSTKLDTTFKLNKNDNDNEILNGTLKYEQSFDSNKKDAKLEISIDASSKKVGKGTLTVETKTKQLVNLRKEEIQDSVKVGDINQNDSILFKLNLTKKLPSLVTLITTNNKKVNESN